MAPTGDELKRKRLRYLQLKAKAAAATEQEASEPAAPEEPGFLDNVKDFAVGVVTEPKEAVKGFLKGGAEATRQASRPILAAGMAGVSKLGGLLEKLPGESPGSVIPEKKTFGQAYKELGKDKIKPTSRTQEVTMPVGEFGAKAVAGAVIAPAVLPAASGAAGAAKVLGGVARGAVQNLPFVPKAFEEGGAKGAAVDIAINTAMDAALPFVGKGVRGLGKLAGKVPISQMELDKAITKGVSKGIKPTVVGKPSIKKLDKFYDNAKNAVRTITKNKGTIELVDEAGEAIPRPRNAKEFAEAIDKTKSSIYKQYHEMAVGAGDSGAMFDLGPIEAKIVNIASPENTKVPPKVRKYAADVLEELRELDGAAPEVVEERIKDLNSSLASFYSGRGDKATAQVDASIARIMREQLDKQITAASGPGYKELKSQYGSLISIEKEVAKRALVNARRANKSLFDMTDIFTGGDLVAGAVSGNPALVARGVFGRGLKEAFKAMNDPDRAIDAMFKVAYRASDEASGKAVRGGLGALGKKLGSEGGMVGGDVLKGTRFEKLTPAIKSPDGNKVYNGLSHKSIFNEQIAKQEPQSEAVVWKAIFDDNTGEGSPIIGFIDKYGEFISRIDAETAIENMTTVSAFNRGSSPLPQLGLTAAGSLGALTAGVAATSRKGQAQAQAVTPTPKDRDRVLESMKTMTDEELRKIADIVDPPRGSRK